MPASCLITGIPYGGDLRVTVNVVRDLLRAGVIHATESFGVYEMNEGKDSELWAVLRHR